MVRVRVRVRVRVSTCGAPASRVLPGAAWPRASLPRRSFHAPRSSRIVSVLSYTPSPMCTTRSKESRSHVLAVPLITVRVRDR